MVLNDDFSSLGNLVMLPFILNVAESITAAYTSSMNNNVVTYFALILDTNSRVKNRIITNFHISWGFNFAVYAKIWSFKVWPIFQKES